MRTEDFKLGMRVRRRSGESAFVRDRITTPRRVGIVVGLPEAVNGQHRAVRVQPEGSTIVESILVHRLEALPLAEQPVALGGKWSPGPDTFLARSGSLPSKRSQPRTGDV